MRRLVRETIFYYDFASEYSTMVRSYYRSYDTGLKLRYNIIFVLLLVRAEDLLVIEGTTLVILFGALSDAPVASQQEVHDV